jgi:hypothetical protein
LWHLRTVHMRKLIVLAVALNVVALIGNVLLLG